ncbi:Mobile element protein [Leuconostoc mesenteroides subsp. cremoris T26]|nr:Mobile element protein [Leuconostoc mesenteroides subsp. cremoris T26]
MTSLSSQESTIIQILLELNYSVRAIARFIKRSPSTVSIEIHQVTPYKAEIAHALALKKRHLHLSLIHISEPTRQAEISYAVFCLKKKKKKEKQRK